MLKAFLMVASVGMLVGLSACDDGLASSCQTSTCASGTKTYQTCCSVGLTGSTCSFKSSDGKLSCSYGTDATKCTMDVETYCGIVLDAGTHD